MNCGQLDVLAASMVSGGLCAIFRCCASRNGLARFALRRDLLALRDSARAYISSPCPSTATPLPLSFIHQQPLSTCRIHQPSSPTPPKPLSQLKSVRFFDFKSLKMAPKAAQKTPTTAGKAPAGKAPSEKKEAGQKTAAPSGDKKKRSKSRKETYSSYIYKGTRSTPFL